MKPGFTTNVPDKFSVFSAKLSTESSAGSWITTFFFFFFLVGSKGAICNHTQKKAQYDLNDISIWKSMENQLTVLCCIIGCNWTIYVNLCIQWWYKKKSKLCLRRKKDSCIIELRISHFQHFLMRNTCLKTSDTIDKIRAIRTFTKEERSIYNWIKHPSFSLGHF